MKHTQTKFFIMFLAGILFSALSVFAATISVNTDFTENAVQYLQQLVLTDASGTTTGVVIDGINKKIQSDTICSTDGTNCKSVADLSTGSTVGGESVWSENGTDVFYTGGNVGIGTDTPNAKLDVSGTLNTHGLSVANDLSVGNEIHLTNHNISYFGGNTLHFGDRESDGFGVKFYESGFPSIVLTGGKVGIGTSTPDAKLDVYGETMILGNTTTKIISEIEDGRPKIRGIQNGTEKWLLGSYDTFGEKNLSLYTIDTGELHLGTHNQSRLTINGYGNVGIGTNNPQATLDVSGTVAFSRDTIILNTGDTLTPTKSYMHISCGSQGGCANTISNGNADGQILIITSFNQGETNNFMDADSNLAIAGGFDMDWYDTLQLIWNDSQSQWIEISRSSPGD